MLLHRGNPESVQQHWRMWVNKSRQLTKTVDITKIKHSKTKPWAHFMDNSAKPIISFSFGEKGAPHHIINQRPYTNHFVSTGHVRRTCLTSPLYILKIKCWIIICFCIALKHFTYLFTFSFIKVSPRSRAGVLALGTRTRSTRVLNFLYLYCTRTREFQIHSTRTCTRSHGQVLRYSYEYWHEYWYSMVHLRCKGENHHSCEINSMTYHKGKVLNWFILL